MPEEYENELLTSRMVPLLRDARKGVEMQVLLACSGKAVAVFLARHTIPASRRQMLRYYLAGLPGASGSPRYVVGSCVGEDGLLSFKLPMPAGGLAKRIKAALLRQTGLRMQLRVRGAEDEDDLDIEEGHDDPDAAESAGRHRPPPPPAAAALPPKEAADFKARLAELVPRILQSAAYFEDGGSTLRLQARQAATFAQKRDFSAADALLDRVSAQLAAAPAKNASSPSKPSAERIQRFRRAYAQAARRKAGGPGVKTSVDALLLAQARIGDLLGASPDESARAQALLAHEQGRWRALGEGWQAACQLPVPAQRQADIAALVEQGGQVLAAAQDLELMERSVKRLVQLHALPEGDKSYLADLLANERNWFKLKHQYESGALSKERMQALWNYRQKTIDELMDSLQKKYRFRQAAVGSTDLSSDIDVGILSHGEQADGSLFYDWQIVEEFNRLFRQRFGQEPGVMFDVNLYAAAPGASTADELPDGDSAKQSMQAMTRAGQDLGALIKQRRYMSEEEFAGYQNALLQDLREQAAQAADPARRQQLLEALKVSEKQFSEADALYQISMRRTVTTAVEMLSARLAQATSDKDKARIAATRKLRHALVQALAAVAAEPEMAEGQALLIQAFELVEQDLEVSMAVNNHIYTESVKEVRELEQKVFRLRDRENSLQQQIEALRADPERDWEAQHELEEQSLVLERLQEDNAAAGLTARISQLYALAVLFANEAYLSEGPMKHIVEASQGVRFQLEAGLVDEVSPFDWQTMNDAQRAEVLVAEQARRRGALSPHHCLQSFNEQLGDLLKDLRHYRDQPAGYAFYRSSKYLARLLDALLLLQEKLDLDGGALLAGVGLGGTVAGLVQAVQTTIVPVRGGRGDALLADAARWQPAAGDDPAELERKRADKELALQAYVVERMQSLFGISEVDSLHLLASKLARQVNVASRSQLSASMKAEDEKAFFRSVRRGDRDTSGARSS